MKQSMSLIPTLKETPADAEIKSHIYLLRAGFMRQNASGVYSFLPLGKRVLAKIENIVREEMDRAGAAEVLMSALQPAELWQESGRWYSYGPELMRLKDRHERDFALGATHEEMITTLVRDEIKSYKRLPLTVYQIQSKFRDEKRPRFGLLRGREFLMKDAYSFHAEASSLDDTYERMKDAYSAIFSRCGLNFRAVLADSGAIGGKDNHEFMVLSEIGEDTIAYSDSSDFAANIEMAPVIDQYEKSYEAPLELEKKETPNQKTIEEVSQFFQLDASKCIKSLLFKTGEEFVLVLVRGDHEVNDVKLNHLLDGQETELATPEEVKELLGTSIGSLGPIGVKQVKIIADHAVKYIVNGVCGANEDGYHFINVNPERDFSETEYQDIRLIQEGDPSPDSLGTIKFAKGIEVGHVFKLGTIYSEKLNAAFLDENGKSKPMIMGCYGIGVSRLVAAIAEQFSDEKGLLWPDAVAPYQIHLIAVNPKEEAQSRLADELYSQLQSLGYEVLYDDRQERPGVKFADSDLFGIPVRLTVGKQASDGIIEWKERKNGEMKEVKVEALTEELASRFKK
ncbi:prolyl-tRNA synthetase [Bacillus oleivorans]|uniref:Proline--tRNA ligase n=1 Tax=Bacillus oleivorans TaxID=1448271 RepID=A0A285D1W1_9BACI|nr:proline--tRNA ligase [Bacillus oleivorans]SNX73749.1 prolyl-tRNA synthetase [Bacillus oleivorans]